MKTNIPKQTVGPLSLWSGNVIDEWIDSFFSPHLFNSLNSEVYPTDEYFDENKNFNIEIPLAGFSRENIKVFVEGKYLVLEAKKQEPKENVKYVSRGIRKKELARKWYLGDVFENDSIESSFKDGLLTIIVKPVKKAVQSNKKEIEIK
jgi:HSP20 family molecular chaperone IbpA